MIERSHVRAISVRLESRNALLVSTAIVVIAVWELLSRVAFARLQLVFPSLVDIVASVYALTTSGVLTPHFVITAQEVGAAIALAILIGIPFGTIIGSNELLAEGVEPLLYYFSSVPKIVLYPIFLMALGIGVESKIVMGFLSAMFPLTVNVIVGTLNVRQELVQVAHVYRASRWELLKKVYVPSTITYIINGLRLGVGVAIISVLLAELFASQAGLGNLMQFYFNNLQTANMYAVLLIVFVLAFALNISLLKVQDYLNRKGYGSGREGNAHGF